MLFKNNLERKLFSSLESPTTFDESFEATSVLFFIPNFKLWIRQIFRLKFHIGSFYIDTILEQNKIVEHIHNTFIVPCKKSKMVSYASSIMISILAPPLCFRFPVKLIIIIIL